MKTKSMTYSQAFREAQELAPAAANVYHHGLKLQEPDAAELKHNAPQFDSRQYDDDLHDTEQTAVSVIANLVTGLPRPASNEIDWASAVDAVNTYVDEDVRIQAADEFLQSLADKSTDVTRDEIDDEHPALAAVVISGEYDEEALEDLLYQFVR